MSTKSEIKKAMSQAKELREECINKTANTYDDSFAKLVVLCRIANSLESINLHLKAVRGLAEKDEESA